MWHVSSRSGVATLQTAINLLLTYLHTRLVTAVRHVRQQHVGVEEDLCAVG